MYPNGFDSNMQSSIICLYRGSNTLKVVLDMGMKSGPRTNSGSVVVGIMPTDVAIRT